MPTSRARPAMRPTRWRRWCSTWCGPGPGGPRTSRRGQAEGAVPDGVRRLSWTAASERGGLLLDRRLAVGRLVLVDDALRGGLVERLARVDGQGLGVVAARLGGLAELAHSSLQRRLHGLVALVRSVVL